MNKNIFRLLLVVCIAMTLSSCYTYTFTVGNGPQTGVTVTAKNHYFIYGLAPGETSNPREMAGSDDYQVTIKHTFVDGLLNGLTFGIYTPTTTIVQK